MRSTISKASDRLVKQLPGRSSKAADASIKAGQAVAAGAAGAVATFFLDPQSGKRRRHVAFDRATAFVRHRAADADRQARYVAGHAKGIVHKATPDGSERDPSRLNDPALARKVETEIFRDDDVPKGSINVNAENGVIYLRGEVKQSDQAEQLAKAARDVEGVREVKNLLHIPA
jgi:osmotically-inducible protein OsmY